MFVCDVWCVVGCCCVVVVFVCVCLNVFANVVCESLCDVVWFGNC